VLEYAFFLYPNQARSTLQLMLIDILISLHGLVGIPRRNSSFVPSSGFTRRDWNEMCLCSTARVSKIVATQGY